MLSEFETAVIENDHARLLDILTSDPDAANRPDEKGRTPMDMAVSRGSPATLRLLIDFGAEINKQEYLYGTAPLMQAVVRRRKEIVDMLLRNGADVDVEDHEGMTALDLASGLGFSEIARMLRENRYRYCPQESLIVSMRYGAETISMIKGPNGKWH